MILYIENSRALPDVLVGRDALCKPREFSHPSLDKEASCFLGRSCTEALLERRHKVQNEYLTGPEWLFH